MSDAHLLWLLGLSVFSVAVFLWRTYRSGILAAFGRVAPSGRELLRLALAAALPAMQAGVFMAMDEPGALALWLFSMLYMTIAWYGLIALLPDGLVDGTDSTSRNAKAKAPQSH